MFLEDLHPTPHARILCHMLEKPLTSTTQMNATQDQKDFYVAYDVLKMKIG